MLPVRRTLLRELVWVGANLAILLAYLFVFTLGQATVVLLTSPDGSIGAGWSGDPATQVLGVAVMTCFFSAFYSPLLVVVLIPYRLIVRFVGRPRAVAFGMALTITAMVGVLVPRVDYASVGVLGIALLGYAALLRVPGQTLAEIPSAVRGLIVGLTLSTVWIIGSLIALGWAIRRAALGDWAEAGAVAVAGTAVPAVLLFMDLFRVSVPEQNYMITALLLSSLASGVVALVRVPVRAMRAHRPG